MVLETLTNDMQLYTCVCVFVCSHECIYAGM